MDEINLIEFFAKLWRRKIMIGSITAIFVMISAIYVAIAAPRYDVVANINVGFANGFANVPARLIGDINSLHFDNASAKAEIPPRSPSKNVVKLTVSSPDAATAVKTAKELTAKIVAERKAMIDDNLAENNKTLAEVQDLIDKFNAGDNRNIDIVAALGRRDALVKTLAPYSYKYTEVTGDLDHAVQAKPRKIATIVIGAIAGFVAGIFIALLLDWLKEFHRKRKKAIA